MRRDTDYQPLPASPEVPLIKASELAQYGFCHRAWWLGNVRQLSSKNRTHLARGQTVHRQHERRVQAATRWQKVSLALFGLGGLLLAFAALWLWMSTGG